MNRDTGISTNCQQLPFLSILSPIAEPGLFSELFVAVSRVRWHLNDGPIHGPYQTNETRRQRDRGCSLYNRHYGQPAI